MFPQIYSAYGLTLLLDTIYFNRIGPWHSTICSQPYTVPLLDKENYTNLFVIIFLTNKLLLLTSLISANLMENEWLT